MRCSSRVAAAFGLTLAALLPVGCSHLTKSASAPVPENLPEVRPGVTANSGGDTRGTILYHSPPPPAAPQKPLPDPYEAVSGKWVIGERQKMAWGLAELDDHAHLAAVHAYPVPDPSWKNYTKDHALDQAQHQAAFDAYLLEKYHARFCNQYHLTYDQMILIIREGREKNWPMPPPPSE